MTLQRKSNISGKHAFLSPSTYRWIDDDEDKLRARFFSSQQAALGDRLHDLAKNLIELGVRLPKDGTTLDMYVNDAIGFGMAPEFPLYYSDDCFGTADAICVQDGWLRIHDLKTGLTPAEMKQLLIYAGIFFHEYRQMFKPTDLKVSLRIYQSDAIQEFIPDVDDILYYMDRIKTQARIIQYLKGGEE